VTREARALAEAFAAYVLGDGAATVEDAKGRLREYKRLRDTGLSHEHILGLCHCDRPKEDHSG